MASLCEWASIMQPLLTLVLLTIALPRAAYSDKLRTFEMPGEACDSRIPFGDQFKVVSKMTNSTYEPNVDCYITFGTSDYKRMYLRVIHFNLQESDLCSKDKLLIYDGAVTIMDKLIIESDYGLCGETKSLPNYYETESKEVTIRFVTDEKNDKAYSGFVVLITPFSAHNTTKEGDVSYCEGFRCKKDKKCITKDAFCNDEHQCGDASDEPPNCKAGASANAAISGFIIHMAWILVSNVIRIDGDMTL